MTYLIGTLGKSLLEGALGAVLQAGLHASFHADNRVYNVGSELIETDDSAPLISRVEDLGTLTGLLCIAGHDAATAGTGTATFSVPTTLPGPDTKKADVTKSTFRITVTRV